MNRSRPWLEALEDRCVPVTWGNPWPDASHLTISLAPPGTDTGAGPNNLLATLDALYPRAVWERAALRAFQAWASHANINLGLVTDQGQPLGTAGRPQGDPRFGDIRLSGQAFSPNVLAFTTPPDITGSTWAGDVRINTAASFKPGGYDLYTVLLQEAGHAFGIPNSTDPTSVMYEQYSGPRSGPSAGDIASLQALYGARTPDSFEGATGNNTLATASSLGLLSNMGAGILALQASADLTTVGDQDFYKFNAPSVTGGLQITLHKAGVSLLTPKLTVYNSSGQVIGQSSSTDPLGGDLTVNLSSVTPLGKYYLSVSGATSDEFSVGSYQLTIQSIPLLSSITGAVTSTLGSVTQVLVTNDLHTNDTFLTASLLPSLNRQADSTFDYAFKASISDSYDVDYYKVQAPSGPTPLVMTVTCWGLDNGGLLPRVRIYDASTNLVSAEVLVNSNGVETLQFTQTVPGASYYVKVAGAVSGAQGVGNYFLGIDFGTRAVQLSALGLGTYNPSQPPAAGVLNVYESGLFHFVLGTGNTPGEQLQMSLINAATGLVVGQITTAAGDAVSLTITLGPGQYLMRLSATRSDGKPLTPIDFILKGARLSDPIGPQPDDPTDSTTAPSSPSSSPSTASTTSGSPPPPSSTSSGSTDPNSDSNTYDWSWSGYQSSPGGSWSEYPYGPGYTSS